MSVVKSVLKLANIQSGTSKRVCPQSVSFTAKRALGTVLPSWHSRVNHLFAPSTFSESRLLNCQADFFPSSNFPGSTKSLYPRAQFYASSTSTSIKPQYLYQGAHFISYSPPELQRLYRRTPCHETIFWSLQSLHKFTFVTFRSLPLPNIRSFATYRQKRTHYDVLGVDPSASRQDIKQAFVKLSKRWHPDTNNSPEAADKFREVYEAYSVLSKSDSRKQYDRQLEEESFSNANRHNPDQYAYERRARRRARSDFSNEYHHQHSYYDPREEYRQRYYSEEDFYKHFEHLERFGKWQFTPEVKLYLNVVAAFLITLFIYGLGTLTQGPPPSHERLKQDSNNKP